jgi:hypothetical protein
MRSGGKLGERAARTEVSLSEQVHRETLELLNLADKSTNPAIRKVAAKIAERKNTHFLKRDTKISPNLALVLCAAFAVLAGGACWYAFLHYGTVVAYEISAIVVLLFLVFVALVLLLVGVLSQANFMKIAGWVRSHVKPSQKGGTPTGDDGAPDKE